MNRDQQVDAVMFVQVSLLSGFHREGWGGNLGFPTRAKVPPPQRTANVIGTSYNTLNNNTKKGDYCSNIKA